MARVRNFYALRNVLNLLLLSVHATRRDALCAVVGSEARDEKIDDEEGKRLADAQMLRNFCDPFV